MRACVRACVRASVCWVVSVWHYNIHMREGDRMRVCVCVCVCVCVQVFEAFFYLLEDGGKPDTGTVH